MCIHVCLCVSPAASPVDTGAEEENKQGLHSVSDAKPKNTSGVPKIVGLICLYIRSLLLTYSVFFTY